MEIQIRINSINVEKIQDLQRGVVGSSMNLAYKNMEQVDETTLLYDFIFTNDFQPPFVTILMKGDIRLIDTTTEITKHCNAYKKDGHVVPTPLHSALLNESLLVVSGVMKIMGLNYPLPVNIPPVATPTSKENTMKNGAYG
jgi:hypothetical protein